MDHDIAKAIATSTFDYLQTSVTANEDSGERRVQVYLAVLSAGGVAVGLVAGAYEDPVGPEHRTVLLAAGLAALVVGGVGTLTALRLAKRDCRTTGMLNILDGMRRNASQTLGMPLPWTGGLEPQVRRWRWSGLTGQLALLNSAIIALGVGALAGLIGGRVGALVGVVAFLLVAGLHRLLVSTVYRIEKTRQQAPGSEDRGATER